MIEGIHTTWGYWPDYPDRDPNAWYVELRWVEREGTIRCVGVTLASVTEVDEARGQRGLDHAEPLNSAVLKRLPLGEIIAATRSGQAEMWDRERAMLPWRRELAKRRLSGLKRANREYQRELRATEDQLRRQAAEAGDRAATWRRSGRKPRVDYVAIAQTYNDALDAGEPPKQTVIDKHDLAKTTADRWIAEARRRGLITREYQPGRRQGR